MGIRFSFHFSKVHKQAQLLKMIDKSVKLKLHFILVLLFNNFLMFDGQMADRKESGKGTKYFKNGDKYVGNWKNGEMSGYGVYTWANGDRYEGQYKNGRRHGQGTGYFANGETYVGSFEDGW